MQPCPTWDERQAGFVTLGVLAGGCGRVLTLLISCFCNAGHPEAGC